MTQRTSVVVVGASIAGVQTAQALRQLGFDGSVLILGDERHAPYQRPPLSKAVLAGTRPPESTTIAPGPQDVEIVLGARAVAVDPRAHLVVTADERRWRYDHLVVASGARARRLTEEPDELVLRTRDDAVRLRSTLEGQESLLILGGGFLGMEVASTCAALGVHVTVVDPEPPLQRLLGPELAGWIRDRACARGVRIVQGDRAARLTWSRGRWLYRVGDVELSADVALSAAGDVPNTEWLAGAGLALAPGLRVDDLGRAAEGIYGVGDVTARRGQDASWQRSPFWSAALEQAHQVAHTILGIPAPPAVGASYYWSEQFGLDLRLCGRFPPSGAPRELDGSLSAGSAVLGWTNGLDRSGRDGVEAVRTVAAINHRTPVGRLKRWLTADSDRAPAPEPTH